MTTNSRTLLNRVTFQVRMNCIKALLHHNDELNRKCQFACVGVRYLLRHI